MAEPVKVYEVGIFIEVRATSEKSAYRAAVRWLAGAKLAAVSDHVIRVEKET